MCISIGFFFAILIYLVLIVGGVMLIRLWLPAILSKLGEPGNLLTQSINILIWMFFMIMVIYIFWDLVSCLAGPGGFHLPRLSGR